VKGKKIHFDEVRGENFSNMHSEQCMAYKSSPYGNDMGVKVLYEAGRGKPVADHFTN